MSRVIVFSLGVVLLLNVSGRAGQDDAIRTKLDRARATYDERVDSIRGIVLKSLDDKEDAARKAGNKMLVDQIKSEREAFELKGELPKSVNTMNYVRDYKQARIDLEAAYGVAIKEYLKAKKDDEAAATEKDLASFKDLTGEGGASLSALLTKDTVWNGVRRVQTAKGKLGEGPIQMKVGTRDGKNFTGEVILDKTRKYSIEGLVVGDKITFTTEQKGNFKNTFEGRLRGGVVELIFSGTGIGKEAVRGTVVLTLDKGK